MLAEYDVQRGLPGLDLAADQVVTDTPAAQPEPVRHMSPRVALMATIGSIALTISDVRFGAHVARLGDQAELEQMSLLAT